MSARTAIVITVSDSAYRGQRQDLSGPAVAEMLTKHGFDMIGRIIVPDEAAQIRAAMIDSTGKADLTLTTGGTGIAARDVTPDVTRELCARLIEGIPERMRAEGTKHTPLAALSRALCGVRGRALILNLPGSPKGAMESLDAVINLLPHVIDLLHGRTAHSAEEAQP